MSKLYYTESGHSMPNLAEELTTFRRARKVLTLPPTSSPAITVLRRQGARGVKSPALRLRQRHSLPTGDPAATLAHMVRVVARPHPPARRRQRLRVLDRLHRHELLGARPRSRTCRPQQLCERRLRPQLAQSPHGLPQRRPRGVRRPRPPRRGRRPSSPFLWSSTTPTTRDWSLSEPSCLHRPSTEACPSSNACAP